MRKWLERRWYHGSAPLLLRPLSSIYGGVSRSRAERDRVRASELPVPVIVVGNISVGGTGKTPFVIWLVERLREWGMNPGVISRGYGGRAKTWPQAVTAASDPALVGDEPVLIAATLSCPLFAAPDRNAAARALLQQHPQVDVLVADDGLQHYRLSRQLEICMVDGRRGFGNCQLLPAGPLRELPQRLDSVDLVVVNGGSEVPECRAPVIRVRTTVQTAMPLEGGPGRSLSEFAGMRVHAVAGIGDPSRFFSVLTRFGIELVMHPFPDHHHFRPRDLEFGDTAPVLMTDKDAIKCAGFADPRLWRVPAVLELAPDALWSVRKSVDVMRQRWDARKGAPVPAQPALDKSAEHG